MTRSSIEHIFGRARAVIGMIHVAPLPGSPGYRGDLEGAIARAVAEARAYQAAGLHGLMIENMHDRPYLAGAVGPETVAAMAVVGREVGRAVALPLGVQVLAAANREAVAVALAAGARFVRVESFIFGHVADEGFLQASAGELLRYRRALGADDIRVFADIKKKHAAHAVTADVSLEETARAAEFFLADGVVVTGVATGQHTDAGEVARVAGAVSIPVLVGSGVSPDNLHEYAGASAFIVGSWVKEAGDWTAPVDPKRARALMAAFSAIPDIP